MTEELFRDADPDVWAVWESGRHPQEPAGRGIWELPAEPTDLMTALPDQTEMSPGRPWPKANESFCLHWVDKTVLWTDDAYQIKFMFSLAS